MSRETAAGETWPPFHFVSRSHAPHSQDSGLTSHAWSAPLTGLRFPRILWICRPKGVFCPFSAKR